MQVTCNNSCRSRQRRFRSNECDRLATLNCTVLNKDCEKKQEERQRPMSRIL